MAEITNFRGDTQPVEQLSSIDRAVQQLIVRVGDRVRKARERSHILCGLAVAVSNVDEVVATIRASADAAEARQKLMERRWPAGSIADYIRLIDDPTVRVGSNDQRQLTVPGGHEL